MSKMSDLDLWRQMNLPLRTLRTMQTFPSREEVVKVVHIMNPKPITPDSYEPYSPEFCPHCGSRNWECLGSWDFECYDCGKLFSEHEGGDE